MQVFGLIGYPLSHSFSKKYFSEKFEREGIKNARYELFELPDISGFPELLRQQQDIAGLNVTIPYKQQVMPYLDGLDASAEKVGAVNVIRKEGSRLTGYNSDYFGFRSSLENWRPDEGKGLQALVLGTGGASKAVTVALSDMGIPFQLISRQANNNSLSYEQLNGRPDILKSHSLIINTTPLGMSPKTEAAPDIDYSQIDSNHFLYDLVYNPAETLFMKLGKEKGARVKNGLEMLEQQAEKAWEIWNQD